MKTKNKILALVEIAVVLCSVFLVTIPVPTIAAGQDDDVLGIYGNANLDDCIDMRDYTYTARIICWLEEETDLADANYDGRISVADMTQIGLIILGRESELTLVDSADRTVTVNKPVERIVTASVASTETVKTLKAQDKVVGVVMYVEDDDIFFPELSKLPSVGGWSTDTPPDYEKILELNPDIVIAYSEYTVPFEETLEPAGIAVVRLDFYKPIPEVMLEEIEKLGYILNKREEAEEFIDFYEGYMNTINERVEGLSKEDKPLIYFEAWGDYSTWSKGSGGWGDMLITQAGGINIAADLPSESGYIYEVDPEWLIEQNPEMILRQAYYASSGYDEDDPSEVEALRDAIMSRPELAEVTAIKNEDVYVLSWHLVSTARHFVCAAYMAKWFHPELFEDLDPKALHQEYLTEFQGLDIDLDEKGVFVYPPLE